jgi:hypothetical protein
MRLRNLLLKESIVGLGWPYLIKLLSLTSYLKVKLLLVWEIAKRSRKALLQVANEMLLRRKTIYLWNSMVIKIIK